MAFQHSAGLARPRIPDPHGLVATAGGYPAAVRRPRHRHHTVSIAFHCGPFLPGAHIPYPHSTVVAARSHPVAIGCHRHRSHCAGVAFQHSAGLTGLHVPDPHGLVVAAGGYPAAIRRHRHRPHHRGPPFHGDTKAFHGDTKVRRWLWASESPDATPRGDWSSAIGPYGPKIELIVVALERSLLLTGPHVPDPYRSVVAAGGYRSEERRVGKE